MSQPIRISASRIKTLNKCSLQFYYQEIVKIPQGESHIKTKVGSLIHKVFELIMAPKRLPLFRHILREGFIASYHPSIIRYIGHHCSREGIIPYDLGEIVDMINIAFLGIRPYFPETKENRYPVDPFTPPSDWPKYSNEHRFQLSVGEATISGFIDLLLLYPDSAVVIDLKSQGQKFPVAELDSNIQALVYQLAVHKETGFIPVVDFIMVRHPPGPRSPLKHIQTVKPSSPAILTGLEAYLIDIYRTVNTFSLEDAYSSPCADVYFCKKVCPYLRPFDYYATVAEGDERHVPIHTYLALDKARQGRQDGEMVVQLRHCGCPLRGDCL